MEKDVQVGQVVAGKYRIEQTLGRGGMGVVMAALHEQLNQRVALKFLTDNAYQQPEAVSRFVREARAAVQIQSEHVARVMDVGTLDNGAPYMVMEYLRGRDLKDVSSRRGPLPVSEAVDYVLQACDAVAEAHSLGIVHRDLKPSNLFLTERPDGTPLVKVLDFGISKALLPGDRGSQMQMTASAAIMGSPQYMSPEQIRSSKSVDARADVWALGTILHELLTGSPAYVADTVPGLLAMIVADAPPPLTSSRPDAPIELEAAILRCLEKDRERRFASVAALARALERFAPSETKPLVRRIARVLGDNTPAETQVARLAPVSFSGNEPVAVQTNGTWARTGQLREAPPRRPLHLRSEMQIGAAVGLACLGALGWLFVSRSGTSPGRDVAQEGTVAAPHVPPAIVAPPAPAVAPIPAAPVPATALAPAVASAGTSIPRQGTAPSIPAGGVRPIVVEPAVAPLSGAPGTPSTAVTEAASGQAEQGSEANRNAAAAARSGKKGTAAMAPAARPRVALAPKPPAARPSHPSSEAATPAAPVAPPVAAKKADTLNDLFNDTK